MYILNIDIIIRGLITVITIAVGPNPSIEVFASELISDASALYCCPSRGALVIVVVIVVPYSFIQEMLDWQNTGLCT